VPSPVIRKPHHTGILNIMFRAKAAPITTKNKPTFLISIKAHLNIQIID